MNRGYHAGFVKPDRISTEIGFALQKIIIAEDLKHDELGDLLGFKVEDDTADGFRRCGAVGDLAYGRRLATAQEATAIEQLYFDTFSEHFVVPDGEIAGRKPTGAIAPTQVHTEGYLTESEVNTFVEEWFHDNVEPIRKRLNKAEAELQDLRETNEQLRGEVLQNRRGGIHGKLDKLMLRG